LWAYPDGLAHNARVPIEISFRLPSFLTFIPGFMPGVLVSGIAGVFMAPAFGRWLGTTTLRAWLVLIGFGIVVSATLTPLSEGQPLPMGACDFSRMHIAPLADLLRVSSSSLNVLLLVPLGVAVGLLPPGRRTTGVVIIALAMPFLVEVTQSLVPALGRGCQTADMVDNLLGVVIGLAAGWLLSATASRAMGHQRPQLDS
jgi:glycopeptide antibiotics resistance protein